MWWLTYESNYVFFFIPEVVWLIVRDVVCRFLPSFCPEFCPTFEEDEGENPKGRGRSGPRR